MVLNEFEGQPYLVRALLNAINNDQLAHAYLFVGPRGIGKRELAIRTAQALNCGDSEDGDGCGQCRVCTNIREGNHPDVKVIEPGGASIGIKAVQEDLVKDMVYRPFEGRRKVYIVDQAESMTTEAANSLLKALEEPPPYALILLLTDNPQALLPTIRSRVQQLAFHEVAPAVLIPMLKEEYGVSGERAAFYATLARGNPGEARRLAESETVLPDRDKALDMLDALAEGQDEFEAFEKAQELAERGREVADFLDLMIALLRDIELMVAGEPEDRLVNQDNAARLREYAQKLPAGAAGGLVILVEETMRALRSNANTLLACEVFLLKARGVLRGSLSPEQVHLVASFGKS